MLPPNTITWNLLKRRMLADSRGALPTPQETTFPDYETHLHDLGSPSSAHLGTKNLLGVDNDQLDGSSPRCLFGTLPFVTS
jgi:hypothetical protein